MPGAPINTPLETTLRRLQLCSYAIQEIHTELEKPSDPEQKADLLIAVENVAFEALDLLQTTKVYAWGKEEDQDPDFVAPDDIEEGYY